MKTTQREITRTKRSTLQAYVATGVVHFLGVSLVFMGVVMLTLSPQVAVSVAETSLKEGLIREAVLWRAGLQFGLAACFWAMGYILFTSIRLRVLASRTPRLVRRAAGTVVTETLIVMPVLLLLIFGLAQLSLNNIAGILGHVASFQAARTVWVWGPENVSQAELEQRVRVAVAATMAPVASGNFPAASSAGMGVRAHAMRDLMKERFETGAGRGGGGTLGSSADLSIVEGLDGDTSHTTRAERKFTHAYYSVGGLSLDRHGLGGVPVGATMTYQHHQAMPLVGRIFGENIGGHYYFALPIGMKIPSQLYGVGRPEGV